MAEIENILEVKREKDVNVLEAIKDEQNMWQLVVALRSDVVFG